MKGTRRRPVPRRIADRLAAIEKGQSSAMIRAWTGCWRAVLPALALVPLLPAAAFAFAPHPAPLKRFPESCEDRFQHCEDRIVDIAISLIMESNPLFCDPRNEDPALLTRQTLAWLSTHPLRARLSRDENIAQALVHVRPCALGPWGPALKRP